MAQAVGSVGGLGVPTHVTVLYPFIPPERIGADLLTDLETLFDSVPSFPFRLETVNWFGEQVVWLAPEPNTPFRKLTKLVTARWPEFPPYGGRYPDIVPHLTVGDGAPIKDLKMAAGLVAADLPISSFAREVWLMTGSNTPNSWRVEGVFPLGPEQA